MFRRDYLERLIEQFAKTLGSIIALRKARRLDEAGQTIAESARNHVGLEVATLLALPLDQLAGLLSPGGILDPGKTIVVAELLIETGELSELQGDAAAAYRARLRALGLLLELSAREGLARVPDPDRYRQKILDLREALAHFEPAFEIESRLPAHHVREGDFAAAENVVFALIEEGHNEIVASAIALYEGLLERDDAELERGGLPRDEVVESLAELRAL